MIKIVATRCQIFWLKCTKFDFGWCSAPDSAGLTSLPQIPYLGSSSKRRGLLLRGGGKEGTGGEGEWTLDLSASSF